MARIALGYGSLPNQGIHRDAWTFRHPTLPDFVRER
jgi:hypothetical protein